MLIIMDDYRDDGDDADDDGDNAFDDVDGLPAKKQLWQNPIMVEFVSYN